MMNTLEMDFIGYGYDVFEGEYADSKYLKKKVFSFSKLDTVTVDLAKVGNETTAQIKYPKTKLIDFHSKNETHGIEREGNTLNSYGTSLQTSLDTSCSYNYFSGEVSGTFSEDKNGLRSKRFQSHDFTNELGVVDLIIPDYPTWFNSEEGKTLIDTEFREDLVKLDIEKFFEAYGTHWVSKIVLGGCARLSYTSMIDSENSEQDLKTKAIAAYNGLAISVKGSTSDEWSKIVNEQSEQYCFCYKAIGGDTVEIASDPVKWINSVSNNPAVISFGDPTEKSLVPVWEFLTEGDPRRKEFEDGYATLLPTHKVPEAIGTVTIYDHTNFSGESKKLSVGDIKDLSSLGDWKNNIDSIDIPNGLVVTAWSYPNFSSIKYGPYRGPVKINTVYGQNDWDSMKIEYSDNVEPFVEIFAYTGFDYSKKCATITEGEYPNLDNFNLQDWQNDIDSIIIPAGLRVTAWSYPNFSKKKYGPYDGPMRIEKVEGQNDWDSMKIEKIV